MCKIESIITFKNFLVNSFSVIFCFSCSVTIGVKSQINSHSKNYGGSYFEKKCVVEFKVFIMLKQKALNPVEIRFRAFALHIHIDFMLVSVSPNELFLD